MPKAGRKCLDGGYAAVSGLSGALPFNQQAASSGSTRGGRVDLACGTASLQAHRSSSVFASAAMIEKPAFGDLRHHDVQRRDREEPGQYRSWQRDEAEPTGEGSEGDSDRHDANPHGQTRK